MPAAIHIDRHRIAEFCRRWQIREFSLFGSVLRSDFGPESDVDATVRFAEGAEWSLSDWVDMLDELREMVGRHVDLVDEDALRNPFRRHAIRTSREVVYAS